MADLTAWKNFKRIIGVINYLGNSIRQIVGNIDELETMKEEVLDNPEFKAELKKIIDIYPHANIHNLANDYTKFKALKDYLEENDYIHDDDLYPL